MSQSCPKGASAGALLSAASKRGKLGFSSGSQFCGAARKEFMHVKWKLLTALYLRSLRWAVVSLHKDPIRSESSLWEHSALARGEKCSRCGSLLVPVLPSAVPGSSGLCPLLAQEEGDAVTADGFR